MPRATSIQIYLKAGLEDDDRLLALWVACKEYSRPQDVFRRLLMRGMDEFIAEGEFSERILEHMEQITGKRSVRPSKVRPQEARIEPTAPQAPQQVIPVPQAQPEPVATQPTEPDHIEEYEIELEDLTSEYSNDVSTDPPITPVQDEEPQDIPQFETPKSSEEDTEGDGDAKKKSKYAFIGDIM